MSMMTLQILRFEVHKNLDLENKTSFSLQIKKFINYASKATLKQKIFFVAEVNFK